mmetsp:Transcript_57654/g.135084  ORF Transcript_57654/g.135084 Transcript_57654/m.135084 type:complete len:551 (+) Transcript_57654:95-1747(+)
MESGARVTPELLSWVQSALARELQALERGHEAVVEHLHVLAKASDTRLQVEKPELELGEISMVEQVEHEPSETFHFQNEQSGASAAKNEVKRPTTIKRSPSSLKDSLTLDDGPPKPFWHPDRFVKSCGFEVFFSFLIFLQAVSMAIEVQYTGLQWGYELQYTGYSVPASEAWPGVPAFLQAIEMFFGCFFLMEMVLKLCGLGKEFFYDLWNWFDSSLVMLWLVDTLLTNLPIETPFLRLIRLMRLIRLVKLVRFVQGFDSLIVMTTALLHSVNALLWVAVIMMMVQLLFALLLNQVLMTLVTSAIFEFSVDEQTQLLEYFGTFPRAMLTMFQMTLGTWVPVARILQELVSPIFNLFTIVHKVTVGFACIGVINGVFMQETMRVAQTDDVIMMRDVARKEKIHSKKMHDFFQYTNRSGSTITRSEWNAVMGNAGARHWFAAQGLPMQDPDLVFDLLDQDKSECVGMDELLRGVSQLQGPARSLDLACLTGSNRQLLADAKAALAALRRNAEPATSSTGTSASRKRSKDGAWVRFEQGNKDQEMTYECVTSL